MQEKLGKHFNRRKIRLIEGNAQCRHLKKLVCKGTSRQVLICLRPRTPYPLPYTLCTCILYTGGGGEESWRRLEGQQFTTLGWKYWHDLQYLKSIISDKHHPQSLLTGQLFRRRQFALVSIKLINPLFQPIKLSVSLVFYLCIFTPYRDDQIWKTLDKAKLKLLKWYSLCTISFGDNFRFWACIVNLLRSPVLEFLTIFGG